MKAHAWKVCDRREVIPGFESLLLRILHCVKNTGTQAILKGLDDAWVSVFFIFKKPSIRRRTALEGFYLVSGLVLSWQWCR